MLRHRNIDRICCAVLAVTLLLTCGFMGAAATGLISGERTIGYENRLFDQSQVHTIDIVMDDWDGFLETCSSEEYSACTLVIDGEKFGSAAIRGKGNTSLSSVESYGNDRYSFKIEFDHYQSGRTYHGLDKLSLNNLIQDKTYMKDYLAYTLMNKMGVAAPLCSFVQINVNGEPWGLYLAVEGVEDSFLSRNYGSDSGELYKPDSMSFGGGRGNGRDFDMDAFSEQFGELQESVEAMAENFKDFDPGKMGDVDFSQMGDFDPIEMFGGKGGGKGAMGSSDVMLQYTDDDPESYSNIFNNAKTDVTEEDQQRLIASLKTLSEGEAIESVVDTDAVIRYLVVHNFLCNDDSYTGTMVHNYYLYEEDGVLSMIPWDYNLAFGAFSMGGMGTGSGATSTVNSPIDSPVSSGDVSSRPIISWIFESEEYTARYHELYAEFVEIIDGWLGEEIQRVSDMIAPYVEAEMRAFFTYEEFQSGVTELAEFCDLRAQSIAGQLDGSIPSTSDGQRADSSALVDGSGVDLSAMGEFNQGGGGGDFGDMKQMGMRGSGDGQGGGMGGFGGQMPGMPGQTTDGTAEEGSTAAAPEGFGGQMPSGMNMPGMPGQSTDGATEEGSTAVAPEGFGGQMPSGMTMPGMPGQSTDGTTEEGSTAAAPEGFDGQMPSGMTMPGMPGQTTQTEASAEETSSEEAVDAAEEPANVPELPGMPSDFQGGAQGTGVESLWLMATSLIALLAAILFAKFYKSNR